MENIFDCFIFTWSPHAIFRLDFAKSESLKYYILKVSWPYILTLTLLTIGLASSDQVDNFCLTICFCGNGQKTMYKHMEICFTDVQYIIASG